MGFERKYSCFCPDCGKEKQSRRRDMGKLCSSCNMKTVEKQFRHCKIKENKPSSSEHCKNYREKRKFNKLYRAQLLVSQAKGRASKYNIPFDLTVEDVLEMWPSDNRCPVFGYEFKLDGSKTEKNFSPSLDKVVPWLGYTKQNTRVISWEANRKKADSSVSDLKAILAYIESNKEDS